MEKKATTADSHITILICSKNDSDQVSILLQGIDSQVDINSKVEVLIVDDFSDSQHRIALNQMSCRFPKRVIKAEQDLPGKKAALISGVKASKPGVILLTDADCRPRSRWIAEMSSLVNHQGAILGFSPFAKQKKLVNLWSRYEGFITALQYLGWAALGRSYMGVGRSLALHSQAIGNLQLTDLSPNVKSGDDDMLVQYLGKAIPCLTQTAFVDTDSPQTWGAYWRQKRRHYSISPKYRPIDKVLLSLYSGSQVGILLFGIALTCMGFGGLVATVWCMRFLLMAVLSYRIAVKLEQRDLWFLLPILDGLLSIYYLVFSFTFLLPKPRSW